MTQNADYVGRYGYLVGRIVTAQTSTKDAHPCRVEVTSIEDAGPNGAEVWGYRHYPNRARIARQTAYPRRYFVPTEWLRFVSPNGS